MDDQLLDLNTPLAQAISTAGAEYFKTAAASSDPAADDTDALGLGSSLPLSLSAALVAPHEIALSAVSHNSYSRIDAEAVTRTAAPGSAPAAGAPGAPGPAASMSTLANYLTTGFWSDFSGAAPRAFNLGSSGTSANNGVIIYDVNGWAGSLSTVYGSESDSDGITAARAHMVREAFALYGEVLGITFVEADAFTSQADVDFFFKDNSSGAYEAEQLAATGVMDYSVINVNSGWSGGSSNIGGTNGYTFQTFLHEIGHALGLGHQGNYNAGAGTPTYATSAQWANDSWAQTMMSYWDQAENTEFSTDSYAQLVSPMAVDWIALNTLYAGQGYGTSNAFNGNTVYGVGTNITNAVSEAFAGLADFADTNAFTIVDGSGIDTVDFSNYGVNQTINLALSSASNNRATLSSVGGLTYNMTIAVGTIIENATTGAGNDFIFGNEFNNELTGNGGNDYIAGYGGSDTLYAGSGTDTLYGGDGNDYLYSGGSTSADLAYGGAGNDFVTSGLGTETMDGGADTDIIDHRAYDGNYVFDMTTGATNFGGESYTNFEAAWMGDGNDSVTGTSGANTIYGGLGDDTLNDGAGGDDVYGGDGNDLLLAGDSSFTGDSFYGGAGTDTLSYENHNWGTPGSPVVFDFTTNTATFNGFTETFSSIEVFRGSQGDETIISNGGSQSYFGLGGNDSMLSGLGNETMDGGSGTDVIDHRVFDGDYLYNMTTGLTNFGGESYTSFEIVYMGDGNDTLIGAGSQETLYGGLGDDIVQGGFTTDDAYGGAGNDTIRVLDGEFYDNSYGGSGTDVLDHSGSTYSGDIFDFENSVITGTHINSSSAVLSSIEEYQDGSGANTIISDGDGHVYYGNAGNDTLVATSGAETMYGGADIDTVDLSVGNFTYHFNTGTGLDTVFTAELFLGFERFLFGSSSDVVTSSSDFNAVESIYGGGGNDVISKETNTGTSAIDTYDGGADIDTFLFNYASATSDYIVNLNLGMITFIGDARDLLLNFENVTVNNGAGITGNALANVLTATGVFDNAINAGGGNDTVFAGAGNDKIDGGTGADSMTGGAGDDTYSVDDGGDVIVELNETGVDVVRSTIAFSLNAASQYLENLILLGSADINGIGNAQANNLTGNTGANALTGGAGNDALYGGGGNDTLNGGLDDDALYGGVGNDSLLGAAGNDTLNGAVGADTMSGGLGDDFYVVNDAGDVVIELSGPSGGIDTVNSLVTFSLAAMAGDLEHLILGGAANINGTGNGLANALTGNDGDNQLNGLAGIDSLYGGLGNDTLDGGTGADVLVGGTGNDVYVLDDAGDTITELAGEGTADLILTDVDVQMATLAANVENLTMRNVATAVTVSGNALANTMNGNIFANSITGWGAADSLFGGAGHDSLYGGNQDDLLNGGADNDALYGGNDADTLIGNIGNDTLYGQAGDDSLTGGAGGDVFVFAGAWGSDTISDFATAGLVEKIDLSAIAAIVNFADLVTNHLTQLGLDSIITNGANTITLTGITMGNLSADDFLF